MFKRLAKQLKTERGENNYFPMSSPVNSLKEQIKLIIEVNSGNKDIYVIKIYFYFIY